MSAELSPLNPRGEFLVVHDNGDGEVDHAVNVVAAAMGMEVKKGKIGVCPGPCGQIRTLEIEGVPIRFCEACAIVAAHREGCRLRLAATCAVPIACGPHGLDICAECGDVCDCYDHVLTLNCTIGARETEVLPKHPAEWSACGLCPETERDRALYSWNVSVMLAGPRIGLPIFEIRLPQYDPRCGLPPDAPDEEPPCPPSP